MPKGEAGESPRELTGENLPGKSHEQLVQDFRTLIRQQEQQFRGPLSPEEIIRERLDHEWRSRTHDDEKLDKERGAFFSQLQHAWDALSYDRYEPGSREEGLAGSILQARYSATREPTIKLSDPMQVRLLDAMAEAADVPHTRGKTEIEIPEKLRNYNHYLMSKEYQERLTHAQAKKNT